MYFANGLERNLKNVLLLSKPFLEEHHSLHKAYVKYLDTIQPGIHRSVASSPEFVRSPSYVNKYIQLFNVDSALNDIHNDVMREDSCGELLLTIKAYHQQFCVEHPEISELFNLVTRAIFCARSSHAGGGTTSAAIGILWCDPRPNWSKQDYFEFFVHEMTHTLMFLDERVYQHYRSLQKIVSRDNYFMSAILHKPRPLDKVIHSLMVGTEILMFREKHLGHGHRTKIHPPSHQLIKQVRRCIDGLRKDRKFFQLTTRRGLDLLTLAEELLVRIATPETFEIEA